MQIAYVFRLSSSSIGDAKYTSHDRLMAIIKLNPINRFLQRHRKSKLPPCCEFQSRMNLVMLWTAGQTVRQGSHYHFQPDQESMIQQEADGRQDPDLQSLCFEHTVVRH